MTDKPIKLVITTPAFFATPLKKLVVEECPNANRTYFLKAGRIVAVGQPTEARPC